MAAGLRERTIDAEPTSGFCIAELVSLRTLPDDTQLAYALDPAECGRLAGIRKALRRRQFLGGHWLVRKLACEGFGGSPTEWQWSCTAGGQPGLRREGRAISVSVSHSGEWIACAISSEPVGIDVEVSVRERDWASLADYAFPRDGSVELSGHTHPERKMQFLHWWCVHEAKGKRDGHGIQLRNLRRLRLLPCTHDALHAISWPLRDGFLALAGAPDIVLRGCDDRRSCWRFEDAT
jgi:4'-phosphopantetheinyl transferase